MSRFIHARFVLLSLLLVFSIGAVPQRTRLSAGAPLTVPRTDRGSAFASDRFIIRNIQVPYDWYVPQGYPVGWPDNPLSSRYYYSAPNDCGPASVAMAVRYVSQLNVRPRPDEVRATNLQKKDRRVNTSSDDLVAMLSSYGVAATQEAYSSGLATSITNLAGSYLMLVPFNPDKISRAPSLSIVPFAPGEPPPSCPVGKQCAFRDGLLYAFNASSAIPDYDVGRYYSDPGGHWAVIKGLGTIDSDLYAIMYDPLTWVSNPVYWYDGQTGEDIAFAKGYDRWYKLDELIDGIEANGADIIHILDQPSSGTAASQDIAALLGLNSQPVAASTDIEAIRQDGHVTIPDGSRVVGGKVAVKTWNVTNVGTTSIAQEYRLAQNSGTPMQLLGEQQFPPLEPGETRQVSLAFVVPQTDGTYNSTWQVLDPNGSPLQGLLTLSFVVSTAPMAVDSAHFIADASLPDNSSVLPGQSLAKTWRVRNSGSSTWDGYQLIFTHGDQMGGSSPVSIPRTTPGQQIDISVGLRAPDSPGAKAGYWQIINKDGGHVPGGQLWVKVNVVGQTTNDHIASFTADPGSPSSASTVRLRARINWWAQYRAMRVIVDNRVIGEESETDHAFEWDTSSEPRGAHSVILEVADQSDTSWSHPERRMLSYTLEGTPAPANHAPNRPSPTNANGGANDWTVYYSGNTGYLCAQANGDPDGDSVTGYYFDIYESAQLWNSGWVTGSCVTTGALAPNTYKWRVKVRDSRGAESEWSDSWHFTLVDPNVTITECYLEPMDSTGEQFRVHACTSGQGGVNVTLRISANEAADGSSNGKWNQFFELGVPCFTSENYPTWFTLPYADGNHRLRCEARGNTLSWTGAAVRDITYTLPHRRPNGAGLVAPVTRNGNYSEPVYLNSRDVNFKWLEAIRASTYTLHVSTTTSPETDPNPVFRQSYPFGTTTATVNFTQDHPTLYWTVTTSNDVGSSGSNVQRVGIDRVVPACQVQALPAALPDSTFRVDWVGSDSLAGIRNHDVQYLDSERGVWSDWIAGAPSTQTYQLFTGQPGHTYSFRCRASDNADNQGTYPDTADTSVRVDPTVRPPTPWWNAAYAQKRNLLIINQDDDHLPGHYPIKMHFDSTTTPTAQEIYDASLSSTKGNDVRVVYNDVTELNRTVQRFTATQIDLWFPLQASLGGGGSVNGAYQLYYGNAGAGSPPADPNAVFLPATDSNTVGLWHFQEGSGSNVADASGRNHPGSFASASWADGWLGWTGNFNGSSGYVNAGNSADFNLAGGPMTIEAWIYLRSPVGENIVSKRANSDESYWLKINPSKELWWSICCSGDSSVTNWGYPSLELGKWYHVAATFDGASTMSVFVNGQKQRTITTARPGRNSSQNLQIGWAKDTTSWFNGYIQHVRVSNVARTDFPYARVTVSPVVASGDIVLPPSTAQPDLALQGLATFPVDGETFDQGVIVQASVKNQGGASTVNGFYTDFYVDHLPTGPGDYSGSVRFFVNEPIAAGATVTVTTVLSELPETSVTQIATAMAPMEEVTSTVYAQTDSTGVVGEITNDNNISATGVSACIAAPDAHEDDDTPGSAPLLPLDSPQLHNFHALSDEDWFRFEAVASETYLIQTSELATNADTYVYLYDTDGTALLASNDDASGALASSLEWTAPNAGTYFVRVRQWNPNVAGCGTSYTVAVTTGSTAVPQAIEDLTATTPAGGVTLTWTHVDPNVTFYRVYRSASPYFAPGGSDSAKLEPDVAAPAVGAQATYTDATMCPGEGASCFYAVVAVSRNGRTSEASNHVGIFSFGVVPGSDPQIPTPTPTPTSSPTPTTTPTPTSTPTPTATPRTQWELLGFGGIGVLTVEYSPLYAVDQTILASTYDGTVSGLYRSTDAGATWQKDQAWTGAAWDIVFSPNYASDSTLFAATDAGDFVRRSTNGGTSWVVQGPSSEKVRSLSISPGYAEDHTVFAGTFSGHVYRTLDGGATWTDQGLLKSTSYQVRALAVSPNFASDRTVFAGLNPSGGVFRSTDAGSTWTAVNSGLPSQNIAALAISPDYVNDHMVLVTCWDGGVYRSLNGGNSWSAANTGQPNRRPASGNTLVFSPGYLTDHTLFYATWGENTDGGVYRSTNGAQSWEHYSDGLGNRFIHHLSLSPNFVSQPGILAGGELANGGGLWVR